MLVEQQELRGRSCVAIISVSAWRWPPERRPTGLAHPVLQAHAQQGDLVAEAGLDRRWETRLSQPPRPGGQGKVFLDGHAGRCRASGPGTGGRWRRALVLRAEGHVLAVQEDFPGVCQEAAGDGVEQGRFARAVGADDGDEVAGRGRRGTDHPAPS